MSRYCESLLVSIFSIRILSSTVQDDGLWYNVLVSSWNQLMRQLDGVRLGLTKFFSHKFALKKYFFEKRFYVWFILRISRGILALSVVAFIVLKKFLNQVELFGAFPFLPTFCRCQSCEMVPQFTPSFFSATSASRSFLPVLLFLFFSLSSSPNRLSTVCIKAAPGGDAKTSLGALLLSDSTPQPSLPLGTAPTEKNKKQR